MEVHDKKIKILKDKLNVLEELIREGDTLSNNLIEDKEERSVVRQLSSSIMN